MRSIILCLALLSLVPQAYALKIRAYTLADLVKQADMIVVATVTVGDGITNATILRSLKGGPSTNIVVDSFAIREKDIAQFTNGETAILFLQKDDKGRRMLLGDGGQGKWPKTAGIWPYADVHVVSLQRVEKAVKALLDLDHMSSAGDQIAKLRSLLSSAEGIDQSCALEYLYACHDRRVRDAVRPNVDEVRRTSKDRYLKVFCDSVNRTNTTKRMP